MVESRLRRANDQSTTKKPSFGNTYPNPPPPTFCKPRFCESPQKLLNKFKKEEKKTPTKEKRKNRKRKKTPSIRPLA